MKKPILSLFILLFALPVHAQNYRCIQPGAKRFFTNSDHYLRGIRVDSVKTIGADTILYLFRTPRGKYQNPNSAGPALDLIEGSWMGKTMIIQQNGDHLVPNYWGDTVFIKTQANLNDSWVIYDDTTSISYDATVTSIDTMTVLGVIDSVKTITITAKNNNSVLASDSLHNKQIKLSKNHGIISTCDLYMFPLHEPGVPYHKGFDYITDMAGSFIFNFADFHNPTMMELYDFEVGDVFKRHIIDDQYLLSYKDIIELDIVINKQISNNLVQFTISRWDEVTEHIQAIPNYKRNTYINTVNINYDQKLLLDTSLMPEETGIAAFYFYNPVDSQFCLKSRTYSFSSNFIFPDGHVNTFEPCGSSATYKVGLGKINEGKCYSVGPVTGYFENLGYVKKNGKECGHFTPLNVQTKVSNINAHIYPNPANEQVTIRFEQAGTYNTDIINTTGQVMKRQEGNNTTITFNIKEFPDGMYYVRITDEEGRTDVRKIVVQH